MTDNIVTQMKLGSFWSDLLGSDVPLRQSVVLGESDRRTSVTSRTNRVQTRVARSSDILPQGFADLNSHSAESQKMYEFLSKKLRRLCYSKMRNYFRTIKEHQYQKFTLSLFNSRNTRILRSAFEDIKKYGDERKFLKMDKTLSKNKNPSLICSVISKIIQNTRKYAFKRLNKKAVKSLNAQILYEELIGLADIVALRDSKRDAWRALITAANDRKDRLESCKRMQILFYKIWGRNKQDWLKKIINNIQIKLLETEINNKKAKTAKFSSFMSSKVHELNQTKEKLRSAKYSLEGIAAVKNKTRYELRNELNYFKGKTRDEIKKLMKEINQLTLTKQKLDTKCTNLQEQYRKRTIKQKGSKGRKQQVQELYEKINRISADGMGEIKAKSMPKLPLSSSTYLESLDNYQLYLNQKQRQLLFVYEMKRKYQDRFISQAEKQAFLQNSLLKDTVAALMNRELQNYFNRVVVGNVIRDLGSDPTQ